MDYEGIQVDDLVNVAALNRAWLDHANRAAGQWSLSLSRIERLATSPFLLFSLREYDDALWTRLLDADPQRDLLDRDESGDTTTRSLQSAAIAFLWNLSRRNVYVARLVSGASLEWCERLAAPTLIDLLGRVTTMSIIEPRFANDELLQSRLLGTGSCREPDLRAAAQIGVLQTILTRGPSARYGRLAAAACRMPDAASKVADTL